MKLANQLFSTVFPKRRHSDSKIQCGFVLSAFKNTVNHHKVHRDDKKKRIKNIEQIFFSINQQQYTLTNSGSNQINNNENWCVLLTLHIHQIVLIQALLYGIFVLYIKLALITNKVSIFILYEIDFCSENAGCFN